MAPRNPTTYTVVSLKTGAVKTYTRSKIKALKTLIRYNQRPGVRCALFRDGILVR